MPCPGCNTTSPGFLEVSGMYRFTGPATVQFFCQCETGTKLDLETMEKRQGANAWIALDYHNLVNGCSTRQPSVDAFNIAHFMVDNGTQRYYTVDESTGQLTMYNKQSFIDAFRHMERGTVPWRNHKVPFITAWLESHDKRIYRAIASIPPPQQCPGDVYNTWTARRPSAIAYAPDHAEFLYLLACGPVCEAAFPDTIQITSDALFTRFSAYCFAKYKADTPCSKYSFGKAIAAFKQTPARHTGLVTKVLRKPGNPKTLRGYQITRPLLKQYLASQYALNTNTLVELATMKGFSWDELKIIS